MLRSEEIPPLHPGEVLRDDFMRPNRLSIRALACALHVSSTRIAGIVRGTGAITADTALRLACYFDTSPWFWMNLQVRFDLELAEQRIPHSVGRIDPLPTFLERDAASAPESKEWGEW
ncbi:HigA family addiction module antitoxin [Stenotrophomonas sp.]|uniref:HigA family addiction module antitoxin n=1 Tax=Stenotrophomonas sp. TaxID=69392 RepID=UPI0028A0AD24|nr:HigA family addiction module antitoxin [Stenotrophomonas sp.]